MTFDGDNVIGFPHGFRGDGAGEPDQAPPNSPQARRPHDFISVDGMLHHQRWFHQDGSPKTGIDFRCELMKVELELIASRLLALSLELTRA